MLDMPVKGNNPVTASISIRNILSKVKTTYVAQPITGGQEK